MRFLSIKFIYVELTLHFVSDNTVIKPSPNHASINPHCTHPISIDFRETAPAGASSHMFTLRPLDPTFDPEQASRVGGLAVAVPGELRGLEKAFELCGGGVSWERLVRPSVALARESKVGLEVRILIM